MSKERLEVLSEVKKQMNKLFRMKESLINRGTLKFSLGKSPFVTTILSETLPTKAKLPSLETYDKSSDLQDYLAQFCVVIHLHGFCEDI